MLAYMIALAVCMGLQAANRTFPGKNGLLLTWLMYAFEALLYVLGIYLGIHPSPDTPTVSFIAFLLAVPLLFVMRPIQHILNVVFFDGVFILTCFLFKSKETLPVDILDGMVFGAVSCIISTFIMLSMHEIFHPAQAAGHRGDGLERRPEKPQRLREPDARLPDALQQHAELCLSGRERPA